MWELIAQNRRKSIIILIAMLMILVVLGGLIGAYISYPDGWIYGVPGAILIWLIMALVAYNAGDKIILNVSHATQVSKDMYPRLYNIVEEMKIAASLPHMPEIYIMNDSAMNAFATGVKPERSAIVVTAGLIENLSRDELQGVIAHEMGHIINRDVAFMTFAGVLMGSINIISHTFLRAIFFTSVSRRGKLGGKMGKSNPMLFLFTLVFTIIAPILASLFYFAISRKREYLADATAARLTRYPEGLASALEKITSTAGDVAYYNKITAPMFIINPLYSRDLTSGSSTVNFSTHPPTHERIRILRTLHGKGHVSMREYQSVYANHRKGDSSLIPDSGLKDNTPTSIRQPFAGDTQSHKKTLREVGDLLMAANGFYFLPCSCGLNIKVPPEMEKKHIQCPRCGTALTVPSIGSQQNFSQNQMSQLGAIVGAVAGGTATAATTALNTGPLSFTKKSADRWETFTCSCGSPIQLSPLFKARQIRCKSCRKKITINYPE
ncbi:M48 family metallopeptidase [bacterium]|nr:M48 family metallopeptidase [bacterium]